MLRLSQFLCGGYLVLALVVIVLTPLIGPLGTAPFPLPIGPAASPVVVSIAYGTEKEEWLQDAAARFVATNPTLRGRPIQIELEGIGSREMVNEIVEGDLQPVVASPASMLQVELLRHEWQTRNNSEIFLEEPEPLVLTPLVIVAWEDRADVLWPDGPNNFWDDLHDALSDQQGWSALGGDSNWGFVKFGHTSPELSNSGIQTLVLLAYGYHEKSTGLTTEDILDPDFQQWFEEVERSVLDFGESTGTFMTNMVQFGPSKYDMVAVYENLAVQNVEATQSRWGPIRVYYPPSTIISEHPYGILTAEWVTPEQQEAAARFRDFLLSTEIQELSLQYGFRPANPDVGFGGANSPFTRYADYGVQTSLPPVVEVPPADALTNLIELWRRQGFGN
ncbi:MAG: substrate-binding domain-containing protein [Chloroflexaceae bacterium]